MRKNSKPLIKKLFLSLMVLLLVLTSASTSLLNQLGLNIDIAQPAEANSQVYVYEFEVTSNWRSNTNMPVGKKMKLTINEANNSITTDTLDWGIASFEGNSYSQFGSWFVSGSVAQYQPYTYLNDLVYYFNQTSGTLSSKGIQKFKQMTVGQVFNNEGVAKYQESDRNTGAITNKYGQSFTFVLNSKTQSGSGGGCSNTSSQTYVYEFEVTSNWRSNTNMPVGKKMKLTINEANNSITTDTLDWGIASFEGNSYSQFGSWFVSGSVAQYQPYTYLNDLVYYFNQTSGTLSSKGTQKFKQMTVGQVFNNEGVAKYQDSDRNTGAITNKYGQSFTFVLNSKTQLGGGGTDCGGTTPPPTTTTVYPRTCASGLTPKGTPGTSSFYCEKPIKQTQQVINNMSDYIGLDKIIETLDQGYGSTGDRGDGDFSGDKGEHSNGWHLDGSGAGYTANFVKYTNVPDNGFIDVLGESWTPELQISQGKTDITIPKKTTGSAVDDSKWEEGLTGYKSSLSEIEAIVYSVSDLDELQSLVSGTGMTDLFTKNGTEYKHKDKIKSATIDKNGVNNYSNMTINKSGYYILATKYVDMASITAEGGSNPSQEIKEKYTYYTYTPISVNFSSDLGYLPVYNNLTTQVNDSLVITGNKKGNHKLANLSYESYKSLKVPSAFNYANNKTLVGSINGGLKLLDDSLQEIAITNKSSVTNLTSCMITDVVEYGDGFFISTLQGLLYLDAKTNTLTDSSLSVPVTDLALYYDTLYVLTETELVTYYMDGVNLIESGKKISLDGMFTNSASKGGRIELVGDLLTISTKDTTSGSEVLILGKL